MQTSIRRLLVGWLALTQVVAIVVTGILCYPLILRQVSAVYDWVLIDSAQSLARLLELRGDLEPDVLSGTADILLRTDQYDWIFYAVHDAGGRLIAGDPQIRPLAPSSLENGEFLYDAVVQYQSLRVGAIAVSIGGQDIVIQVAETGVKRRNVTNRTFIGLVGILVLLCSMTVVLVMLSVGRGLKPLTSLRQTIETRAYRDLRPIALSDVPVEVRPMVAALNEWLRRVDASVKSQHSFLANAAHQLRTPLAGLTMQLEQALGRSGSSVDRESLGALRATTQRIVHLANQLLSLARAEAGVGDEQLAKPVDLRRVVELAANDVLPRSIRKSIDLGLHLQPAAVLGNELLLRELVSNLLDNAVLYTPPGGRVTVSTLRFGERVELVVEDNGPGIPEASREQVFERFHRLDGSVAGGCGLGLAIVREIALLHQATVSIGSPEHGTGAVIRVVFPVDRTAPGPTGS